MSKSEKNIVVCGAGIAGVAAAYYLAVKHRCRQVTIVEADTPLSLTSDKSTEAYRNWWPGPDGAMTAFMDRSIDLMQVLATATDNRFNMSRHGYLFASADPTKFEWLHEMASLAAEHGAGPVRVHDSQNASYSRAAESQYDDPSLTGADIITDSALIKREFPYLNPQTAVVAHARRAGWLSAQQLGMTMLDAAREHGVKITRGEMVGVETTSNRVTGVRVESGTEQRLIDCSHLVLCAGPMLQSVAKLIDLELPVFAERHLKISLADSNGVIPRDAPMTIWLDGQHLPWRVDERAALAEDDVTQWLLEPFPSGVHCRPDGSGSSQTVLALYNYENKAEPVVFPLRDEPHYPEIVMRGLSTMVPGLASYIDSGARPYMDGGYYVRTQENRPLIGPLPLEGAYISAAYSGFGIMASCAGGDLLARHVVGAQLPAYAPSFLLSRYQDPTYVQMLAAFDDDGQL